MLQPKNLYSIIDYRNARYQGHADSNGNRSQLGILIDDDLSFYVSHWFDNCLNGQTLVYISHGKYIYGQWVNNQPNGLNVFRTGDTVLVGNFQNGQPIGRILVIFQKYNIIAVLQKKNQTNNFQVFSCGKLFNHEQLLKYVAMLEIQMPDNYFSLIKFVTSITNSQQNDDQISLIVSPYKDDNCYFGFRDGLAIVFNSNNGVVSVGQHQSKQINGFGGIFDGKNIQEGNFDLKQTITYNKRRPNSQIYTIFQKMHKRSLNFKNQYFDSKVKTLGNLQSLLKGNIQKIVNYNMKNKIHSVSEGDLNDSLDYQNIDQYESIKTAQNRQKMYQKQVPGMKKTISKYCKQQDSQKGQNKSRISKSIIKQDSLLKQRQKSRYKVTEQNQPKRYQNLRKNHSKNQVNINNQQNVRITPTKNTDQTIYYAKKSPIMFRQNQIAYKEKQIDQQKQIKQCIQKSNSKYFRKQQVKPQNNYTYEIQIQERSRNRSPINATIQKQKVPNIQLKNSHQIPKFGGLQVQQKSEKINHKKSIQSEVQQYKRQLQKSRSKQKLNGSSIGKYLKRPSYEDIEERRKRILNQFKQLNDPNTVSNSNSQHKKVSHRVQTSHKVSVQIQVEESRSTGSKKQITDSPCMKSKIFSYTSENENGGQNSSEGYMPLSLINNEKGKNNIKRQNEKQVYGGFSKKKSEIDRVSSTYNKKDKQNIDFGGLSEAKCRKDLSDLGGGRNGKEVESRQRQEQLKQRQRQIRGSSILNNRRRRMDNEQSKINEDIRFSQISIKHQPCIGKQGQRPERTAYNENIAASSISSQISRKKVNYKYYFQQ